MCAPFGRSGIQVHFLKYPGMAIFFHFKILIVDPHSSRPIIRLIGLHKRAAVRIDSSEFRNLEMHSHWLHAATIRRTICCINALRLVNIWKPMTELHFLHSLLTVQVVASAGGDQLELSSLPQASFGVGGEELSSTIFMISTSCRRCAVCFGVRYIPLRLQRTRYPINLQTCKQGQPYKELRRNIVG